ncbi:transposase, partial [Haemophilus parainfluenzae]
QRVLSGKRWVWGRRVYVVATRLEDGELLILATDSRPRSALSDYRLRWGIETLFAALKTRGFNLESTHFCHAERLSKLIALLALAFCWAMLTGLWQHQQQPIPLKAHGRRAKSLFRLGCDFLRRTCCDLSLRRSEFDQALQLLSPY